MGYMVEACELVDQWRLEPNFAEKVAHVVNDLESELGRTVRIISGFRTNAEQDALRRSGRPAAPNNVSNHTICPARAVDISLGFGPTRVQKAILGRIAMMNGLRWGGGSSVDSGGIPSDWQHLDTGPRNS